MEITLEKKSRNGTRDSTTKLTNQAAEETYIKYKDQGAACMLKLHGRIELEHGKPESEHGVDVYQDIDSWVIERYVINGCHGNEREEGSCSSTTRKQRYSDGRSDGK